MRRFAAIGVILFLGAVVAAASGKSPAPSKKSAAKSSVRRATAPAKAKSTGKKATRSRRARRPSGQPAPTPERYREIQQALIDKGYLQGPATGVWSADSVDALKRFERDQKLPADGRIDSLSLISLGLGPRRETAAVIPPPNPAARDADAEDPPDQLDIPTRREHK